MIDDELKIAWAAGFFDGEGTVGIQRRKGRHGPGAYVMQMAVVQKHSGPIQRFHEIAQCGSVHVHRKSNLLDNGEHRDCSQWIWRASGRFALHVLLRLRPHLVVKGDQADVAISFQQRRLTTATVQEKRDPSIIGPHQRADEIDRLMIAAMKHVPFTHSYTQQ